MRSVFQTTIIIIVTCSLVTIFMGCEVNKGKKMNKKVSENSENNQYTDLYELNYQEQMEAYKKFDDFRKKLITKAEKSNSFEDIKEYYVTYAGRSIYIESRVTYDDFVKVLKEGELHGYEAISKDIKYSFFEFYITSYLERLDCEAGISFIYNGNKNKWELLNFMLVPN